MMGPGVVNYLKNLPQAASEMPSSMFDGDEKRWKDRFSEISQMSGSENPYALHNELAEAMISNVLIVRENEKLGATLKVIEDIESRWKNIECVDTQDWTNPVPSFVNQLWNMIQLSKIITMGALQRDEFRGSHYKPDFDLNQPDDFDPADYLEFEDQKFNGGVHKDQFASSHLDYMERFEKNNENWLKSSIATYNNGKPTIDYEQVDTSLIAPRPRKYD
jgi:succinate dehydrogenase / fumarate reductase flavoprotein subunit